MIKEPIISSNQFAIRGMVRDKTDDKARALENSGVELMEADFDKPDTLESATKGVHGVFSMQDFRNGDDTEIRQGKAMADAALTSGVQHFVYSSVGSAERHTGIPHFESKYKVEEYIKSLSLPHTILRPVFFMYNYNGMRQMIEGGTLAMPLSGDTVLQQLSEDDYGNIVANVFASRDAFLGKEIELASTAISLKETAGIFSKVLNREVAYQQVPADDFRKQAGEDATLMFQWFEKVGYDAGIDSLQNIFFRLSSLQEYLEEHGWSKA